MKNLFTLIFSIMTVGLMAQTFYYQESFDSGVPEDWSVEGEWVAGAPADLSSQYFMIPADSGTGDMVAFNDDGLGGNHTGSGVMTTGAIDLTAVDGPLFLEFITYFVNGDYGGANERALVSISTDGKGFDPLTELDGNGAFAPVFIDVAEYAGNTVWLQFTYDDGAAWNFGWALDEVTFVDQITLISPRNYALSSSSAGIMTDAQAGIDYLHEGFIKNNGALNITSFDIVMSNGTDTWTKSYDGIDVPFGGAFKYEMDDAVIVEGNVAYTVEIQNVNGDMTADDNRDDDVAAFSLNAYSALNPNKGVYAEEATGTWCQFCPLGTAFVDEMSKRFPDNFVGVAVHNADPMVNTTYDSWLGSFPGFTGYPQVIIDRTSVISPADMPATMIPSMNVAPPAALTVGAEVSGSTVTPSIQVDFLADVDAAHSVAIVITEDGVTGSDADRFFQVNAWGDNARNEAFAGYELLPTVVPAAFTVFNHVGRELVGGIDGNSQALDTEAYTAGMTDGWVFDAITLPADVNVENIHLVGLLINNATGQVVNATNASILDAGSNGLFDNTATNDVFDATLAEVYPNPVKGIANINLELQDATDITVNVINSLGQTVATRSYGQQAGSVQLQQDMSNLAEGMYMINITAGDRFITKKINKVN